MDTKDGRDNDEGDDWANVMPVSATIIPASKRNATPAPIPVTQAAGSPATSSRRPLWPRRSPAGSVLPTSASTPSITPADPQSPLSPLSRRESSAAVVAETQDKLQLTVLIAMPNANAPRYKPSDSSSNLPEITEDVADKGKRFSVNSYDDDEEEIPEVVFGLTEVLWEAGPDWIPSSTEATNKAEEQREQTNAPSDASIPNAPRTVNDYSSSLLSSAVAGGPV